MMRWTATLAAVTVTLGGACDGRPRAPGASATRAPLTAPTASARWSFDACDDASPTVADDSGHGLDGSRSGAARCGEGFLGKGLVFDGTDGAVVVPDAPALRFTNSFTLAAWVNPARIDGLHTIVNKWYGLDSYLLLVEDGQFVARLAVPGGQWGQVTSAAAPASVGRWTHVAAVYDGSELRLYLDGVVAARVPASGTLQQSDRPLCIGNCPPWNAFSGTIDEVVASGAPSDDAAIRRLAFGAWPNALSRANSDEWISLHHDDLLQMRPRVLALNFVNQGNDPPGKTTDDMMALVNRAMAGIEAGSAYHGYSDPGAEPFLDYELAKAIDLSDHGNPPPGWNHLNSSRLPLKCDASQPYQFDYAALFSN